MMTNTTSQCRFPGSSWKGRSLRSAALGMQRGVTLIEALITLFVLSVGLLGMAALQLVSIQENSSAFRHTQAIWFANDMADRMRANVNPAAMDPTDLSADPEDVSDDYIGSVPAPNGSCAQPNTLCDQGGSNCSMSNMADFDTFLWCQLIVQLPDGKGAVIEDGTVGGRYLVRVTWDDDTRTNANAEGCPSDSTITKSCVELAVEP